MHDEGDLLRMLRPAQAAGRVPATLKDLAKDDEADEEDDCAAFGFVRGTRDKALFLEIRLKDRNTESFAYNLLGSVRFNPSIGLLLKFSGDVTTLVLIRGSNLDTVLHDRTVNLTDKGINRHRIVWVQEMDLDEARRTPKGQPTIDRIEIAEFESADDQNAWLAKVAPVFARPRSNDS